MLNWLPLLQARLGTATENGIRINEVASADPLKKYADVMLEDPIPSRDSWIAFQIIVHAFAAANDCVVNKIRKVGDRKYTIDILTKNRLKSSAMDPFVDDWKSNHQKRKEEFQRYLRDKAEELKKELSDEPEPTSPLPADVDMWGR